MGRVLVVDDNEDAADALAALLHDELGCEVHQAYDGAQALDKAAELHPDVVVMDISLRLVNGVEAASLMRRVFRGKAPRLIAVTGELPGTGLEQARAWGFDQVFGKPVPLQPLLEAVAGRALPAQRRVTEPLPATD